VTVPLVRRRRAVQAPCLRRLSLRHKPKTRWLFARPGELDLSVVEPFEEEVRQAVLGTGMRVLLDLSEVSFIDSTGLRAIVKAEELAAGRGKEFRIWGEISPAIERAFDVTGMAERMPFEGGPLP